MNENKPTERTLIEEAEELLVKYPQERVFAPTSKDLDTMPDLLRRLVAEVKRLRKQQKTHAEMVDDYYGSR